MSTRKVGNTKSHDVSRNKKAPASSRLQAVLDSQKNDSPLLPQSYNIVQTAMNKTAEEKNTLTNKTAEEQVYKCGRQVGICDAGQYCTDQKVCVSTKPATSENMRFRFCKPDENITNTCMKRLFCKPDSKEDKLTCSNIVLGGLQESEKTAESKTWNNIKLEKQNRVVVNGEVKYKCGAETGVCDPSRYCNSEGFCVPQKPVQSTKKIYRFCTKDEYKDCADKSYCQKHECVSNLACGDYKNKYACKLLRNPEKI